MNWHHVFPLILIILQAGAAVVCLFQKDWRMFTYWTAAAVLNASVTFRG